MGRFEVSRALDVTGYCCLSWSLIPNSCFNPESSGYLLTDLSNLTRHEGCAGDKPRAGSCQLPDSYILATERMTCGPSVSATSASLAERASSSLPFLAPGGAFLCVHVLEADYGQWEQMSGSLPHFLGDVLMVFNRGGSPISCLLLSGFPQYERAHGSCCRKTILMLLFNSNKESRILVFLAARTTHARISCLLV